MGFFDRPLFDFNGDGFETYVGLQMMAGSRQEAIALTGDDTFYTGSDSLEEDEDELTDELEMAGLDVDELEYMDEDELEKLWKMQGWIRMIMVMNSRWM